MKPFFTLIVFILTSCLYAQTPTTVLEGIDALAAPMAFHGDELYYVSNNDHVYKIDVTEANPTPQAVFSTDTEDSSGIYDMAFHGDVLYLSMSDVVGTLTEIVRVDLTANTLAIENVAAFTIISSPIAFLGDDLYMITNGLIKLDITVGQNPPAQTVTSSLPEETTNDGFSDFTFHGNVLYMASFMSSQGVYRIDVTAENPGFEKIVESGSVKAIAFSENSLYFDREANRIQRIQDVNGGTLKGADLVSSGIDNIGQMAVHNNIMYIADGGADKILKYNLSPFEGIYKPNEPPVFKGDDLYYVSDDAHIYKISDVTAENPVTEAVVSFPDEDGFSIINLAFYGDDALYVSESDNVTGDRFSKVDLTTNPPSIEEVFMAELFLNTPIAILGDDLYFVSAETGQTQVHSLYKLDLTVPTPTEEEVVELPTDVFANFIFDGNILYMASIFNVNSGVYRVDVTAESPVVERVFRDGPDVYGIAIDNNSLYYSTRTEIYRISDINTVTTTGGEVEIGLDILNPELAVHNNYLYIIDDTSGRNKILRHQLSIFEGIHRINTLTSRGNDLYYTSGEYHIYKISDLTAENPVVEVVVSFPNEFNMVMGSSNLAIEDFVFYGDNTLYVSELDNTTAFKISKVDLTTDPPTIEEVFSTADFLNSSLAILGDDLYFMTIGESSESILSTLDLTIPTPTAEEVTTLPENIVDFAFHENILYAASSGDSNSNGIYRIDVTAETPIAQSIISGDNVRGLVFDGKSLYYSRGTGVGMIHNATLEAPLSGFDFVTGLSSPRDLTIIGNTLYVAETGTDKILAFELPTIWDGANQSFTKAPNADWSLQTNQDRLTDQVWITRQDAKPIYNYKWWQDTFSTDATENDLKYEFFEDGDNGATPTQSFTATGGTKGLRWAILDNTGASTDNWENFGLYGTLGSPTHFYSFNNVVAMISQLERAEEVTINSVVDNFNISRTDASGTSDVSKGSFRNIMGKKLGVWIEDDNIYFTLTFNSWSVGDDSGGGGFSYTRSTDDSTLSIASPQAQSRVILLPNPVRNQLQLFGLSGSQHYTIYNLLGVASGQGTIANGGIVPVSDLPKGFYVLKLEGGQALKFVKD